MNIDVIHNEVKGTREYKTRAITEITGAMIHRTGKDHGTGADFGDTAEEICSAFTGRVPEAAKATGYKVPYTFIVEAGGRIAQCLPLSFVAPHAFKVSRPWLSVAFIGDFRSEPPTNEAFVCGVFLLRVQCLWLVVLTHSAFLRKILRFFAMLLVFCLVLIECRYLLFLVSIKFSF